MSARFSPTVLRVWRRSHFSTVSSKKTQRVLQQRFTQGKVLAYTLNDSGAECKLTPIDDCKRKFPVILLILDTFPIFLSLLNLVLFLQDTYHKGLSYFLLSCASYLLPKGYPHSVGSRYEKYITFQAIDSVAGTVCGVLSMQSMLFAVGLTGSGSIPIAASLNWILKDGLGQLGISVLSLSCSLPNT